jgi:RNA polymerase sigma-70 factor (ECF subfamily)
VEAADGDAGEVLAAMARLSEVELEAVMLTAWEGLSSAEAATAAGCSRAAMRARLSRARRRLAQLIDAGGHDTGADNERGALPSGPERRMTEMRSR